ncbi:hypothetical protein AKJ62_01800 [candidate division MSBL1 archaeon SCGC-AAA259D14]|uniref:Uncharacterized protein n=2 Tax=candidate division MSBL1 TaxID=215777 RepID=A0A133U7A6_9EURY|nr:hypothetical protein AKJ62_01800 [candidate division MSBL1 archaeon SCGC-AAA259D14]KXA92814.1 hypothetical protein AKJ66_03470 [candidate division MSBL1 archaeon SCGC-AAA259E22]
MVEPVKINCDKCGYEWWTKSKMKWVSCPNCQSKTKHPKKEEETEKEEKKEEKTEEKEEPEKRGKMGVTY